MMLLLNNLHTLTNNNTVNVLVNNGVIKQLSNSNINQKTIALSFDNAQIMPGLINSHDHLDFNLFPQLGNQTYRNYTQWGKHIHQRYKTEIEQVLAIPQQLRTMWGVYKNLLCGVTTVVNHGHNLEVIDPLINVMQHNYDLHSVHFEKYWKLKLNNPLKKQYPYVIHTGEGTDQLACREIDSLIRWNLLKKTMVGVHGVAMTPQQALNFKALVWCPQSNYYLLNTTANIKVLKPYTNIVFGTDSTLTSDWNLWEHVRTALASKQLSEFELLNSLTNTPANVWQLNSGVIAEGKDADILITRKKPPGNLNPEDILLVMQRGQIRLFDHSLLSHTDSQIIDINKFSIIHINDSIKYIAGNLPELMNQIKSYHPGVVFPGYCS